MSRGHDYGSRRDDVHADDGTLTGGGEADRRGLRFTESVGAVFDVLLAGFGLARDASDYSSVRFASECVELVVFHDLHSCELSLTVARIPDPASYGVPDMIRVVDRDAAREYRDFIAMTPDGVMRGLQRLAADLREFGERALECDERFFAALASGRAAAVEEYAHGLRRRREDAAAREAFRTEEWPRVIEIYAARPDALSAVETKRLEIALRKATSR